jgi:hypothetical protein
MQPGIVDFRLILPEARFQIALNLQVIQLQFDNRYLSGKVPAHVASAHKQSGQPMTFALSFDHHNHLLCLNNAQASLESEAVEAGIWNFEILCADPLIRKRSREMSDSGRFNSCDCPRRER